MSEYSQNLYHAANQEYDNHNSSSHQHQQQQQQQITNSASVTKNAAAPSSKGRAIMPVMPSTSEWGPKYWYVMFMGPKVLAKEEAESEDGTVSEATQRNVSNFYKDLAHMFPCPDCKTHYAQLVIDTPPVTTSSEDLKIWLDFVGKEVKKNQDRMRNEEIAERAGLVAPPNLSPAVLAAANASASSSSSSSSSSNRLSSCAIREMNRAAAVNSNNSQNSFVSSLPGSINQKVEERRPYNRPVSASPVAASISLSKAQVPMYVTNKPGQTNLHLRSARASSEIPSSSSRKPTYIQSEAEKYNVVERVARANFPVQHQQQQPQSARNPYESLARLASSTPQKRTSGIFK